jgi:signal recognition particle subunit SRP54
MLKKMGAVDDFLTAIPGLGRLKKLKDAKPDETKLKRLAAIIDSMTTGERMDHRIVDSSRKRRIDKGSGTSIAEVSHLLNTFNETQKILNKFSKGGNSLIKMISRIMP